MTSNPTGREGLVERLRLFAAGLRAGLMDVQWGGRADELPFASHSEVAPFLSEAADRIEALEGERDHWKANHADLTRKYRSRAVMIAGLRDMLKEARKLPGPNATRLRRLQTIGVHVAETGSRSVHVREGDFDWLLASVTTSQARIAELERERDEGASRATSGGTAAPKSDSAEGH
jgi:hypothetical protein